VNSDRNSFYLRRTETVARELVGKKLIRVINVDKRIIRLGGRIVETEAYGYSDDASSHAYKGRRKRNEMMFGDVGRAYIYFIYGNHYCLNVSARAKDASAGAVLLRAIEPSEGIDIMTKYRNVNDPFSLASGPGKLTKALNIDLRLNGIDMTNYDSELHIELDTESASYIEATYRIGITKALDKKWRFIDPSSRYLSWTNRSLRYNDKPVK
jgi:DNA-3-methyladenine glycosylase